MPKQNDVSLALTHRTVSNLACDVTAGDLGSFFRWVDERLANQTYSQADSNTFAGVTLLEEKCNIR